MGMAPVAAARGCNFCVCMVDATAAVFGHRAPPSGVAVVSRRVGVAVRVDRVPAPSPWLVLVIAG